MPNKTEEQLTVQIDNIIQQLERITKSELQKDGNNKEINVTSFRSNLRTCVSGLKSLGRIMELIASGAHLMVEATYGVIREHQLLAKGDENHVDVDTLYIDEIIDSLNHMIDKMKNQNNS